MITLEQVEKLRERANISYDEAKLALEETNGDVLEALIQLEKKGSVAPPQGGGYYSSEKSNAESEGPTFGKEGNKYSQSQKEKPLRRFFKFCGEVVRRGNINSFEAIKDGESKLTVSITVLVILILLFFWVTVPLLVIGLFFGFRYVFKGPDFGKDAVNNAMNVAADTVEKVKRSVMEGQADQNNND